MNKHEVLAKSREENKTGDEREKSLQAKAGNIASAVGLALCAIIALLEGIFADSVILFYGCFSIYWGIITTNYLVIAIAEKKKSEWVRVAVDIIIFTGFISRLLTVLL